MPVTPAPVSYQSQIVFKGALAGAQSGVPTLSVGASTQSLDWRDPLSANPSPAPIMIISPNAPNGEFMGSPDDAVGGTALAIVSPMPSAAPQVTFSVNGVQPNLVPTATPAPGVTPQPGVVGAINVSGSNAAENTQAAGTVTATIGAPVSQAPTTPVYEYRGIDIDCEMLYTNDMQGATWNGTTWVAASSPSNADIYATYTAPQCSAPWVAGTQAVLHTPYGGVLFNSATPCSDFSASQWSNTFTSIPLATVGTMLPDYSFNSILLFKTASGNIAKLCPTAIGNATEPILGGAIEVSGDSIDGF